jgi:hypothetical protein
MSPQSRFLFHRPNTFRLTLQIMKPLHVRATKYADTLPTQPCKTQWLQYVSRAVKLQTLLLIFKVYLSLYTS